MTDSREQILADVRSYLRSLQRRGVRAIYMHDDTGVGDNPDRSVASETTGPVASVPADFVDPFDSEETIMADAATLPKTLPALAKVVAACTECTLHESRTQTVFGVGNPKTKLMFIGEAPGKDEDLQGEPFVGRSGQLLTKIIAAIDLKREDVYIANILKCRPPNNRDPQESEVRCCEKYLVAQIQAIKPKIICALGRVSAQWLLRTNVPLSTLRTGEYHYQGIRVIPTYHPAALLRNPNFKKPCWEDFKKIRSLLGEL